MTEPDVPRRYSWRLWWLVTSLPVETALYYAVMGGMAIALGYFSSRGSVALWLALVVSILLFVGLGFVVLMWLMFEDDWWNDTMWEQTTAGLMGLVLHLGALPAAWLWGRSLGG